MGTQLFEESNYSESSNDCQLNTNEKYAEIYNNLRRKELLKKYKENDVRTINTDSSSESSDEDALNPIFDKQFFKTLALLKSDNPKIYDKSTIFFNDDANRNVQNCGRTSKPLRLKDYEREILLEKGVKLTEEPDIEKTRKKRHMSPSVAEETKILKSEFQRVLNTDDDTSCEDELGGIFRKRVMAKEPTIEEEDYIDWLAGKQENIKESLKKELEPLKTYWNDNKLSKSEKFLRDYILNKGYTDAVNYSEIPTYDEIVGNKITFEEDEKELEKQEEFEHKYNFRFEEPDQEFIKRYPRVINDSVRRTNDKRKQKRQEIKERKQQEKEQKLKEIEFANEAKRKEIQEKIRKLKLVTGNDELAFSENEFDKEFDPVAHDKRMQEIFNDDYYQINENGDKPECPSDIEELKIIDWDSYDPNTNTDMDENSRYCEQYSDEDDFNMDCDYDPEQAKKQSQAKLVENTKRCTGRRKRRRNRFLDMIAAEKPIFNPNDEKTYAEYIDEYYKLDCEDIIDNIPCRFKYVETTPNDFGLTIEEILMAKNKELNQWASLKKAVQIRPDYVEKRDQNLYKLKAKNMKLKKKIFKSIYGDSSDEENVIEDKTGSGKNLTKFKKLKKQTNILNQKFDAIQSRKRKYDDIKNLDLQDNPIQTMCIVTNNKNITKRKDIHPTVQIKPQSDKITKKKQSFKKRVKSNQQPLH